MRKRLFSFLGFNLGLAGLQLSLFAQSPAVAPATTDQAQVNTAAAAAVASGHVQVVHPPDFLEDLVDGVLGLFKVENNGNQNTVTHFVVAACLLLAALALRRVLTSIVFSQLDKLAARTKTTLDDKLLPALETPAATFVVAIGIFAALKVLKLPASADHTFAIASTVTFSLLAIWAVLRGFNAVLDQIQEIARAREMGVAAFMPWIKKSLVTIFTVLGVLMVVQNLGYDVKALLAGLGIGGLAFALAAQDTIANLFGSLVVAIDQPFKIGEAVKIGSNEGVVEDIGLRSTKLRTPGKNLIIIPNKTVAAEAIINNSRFVARRVEQVLGLTYDTSADQLDSIVGEIRAIILREDEVAPKSVLVFFRDLSASSLDIWLAYETKNPDFQAQMRLRQRINLAVMRLVEAKGLSFAFPTQTMRLEGPLAKTLAARESNAAPSPSEAKT